LKINLKKFQLLIPWERGDYNIQTLKFFLGGCFLLETSLSKIHEN
jgi:hypothetical protein